MPEFPIGRDGVPSSGSDLGHGSYYKPSSSFERELAERTTGGGSGGGGLFKMLGGFLCIVFLFAACNQWESHQADKRSEQRQTALRAAPIPEGVYDTQRLIDDSFGLSRWVDSVEVGSTEVVLNIRYSYRGDTQAVIECPQSGEVRSREVVGKLKPTAVRPCSLGQSLSSGEEVVYEAKFPKSHYFNGSFEFHLGCCYTSNPIDLRS